MSTDKKQWRNRKAKKELARRLQSENPGLEVVHPHAAGIDVGNGAHYVAVRPDRDPQRVRRLECFTADLYRLAEWLQTTFWKSMGLRFIWSTRGIPRTCPDGRVMCRKASGY